MPKAVNKVLSRTHAVVCKIEDKDYALWRGGGQTCAVSKASVSAGARGGKRWRRLSGTRATQASPSSAQRSRRMILYGMDEMNLSIQLGNSLKNLYGVLRYTFDMCPTLFLIIVSVQIHQEIFCNIHGKV